MAHRHGCELQAWNEGRQFSTPCSGQDLKPYEKFPKLYEERRFAREFPKQKQTLSFTDDLPTEIRLMVYQNVQLQAPDRFFELTWEAQAGTLEPVRNTFRQYATFRKALSLMRLCKKVHGEIAEIFYAEQNFCFSNRDGFLMLSAWTDTIGASHFQYLRHVTVRLPVRETYDVYISPLDAFRRIVAKRGMQVPSYGRVKHRSLAHEEYCYDKTVRRVFRTLESMPCLRRLELLVPWDSLFMGVVVCDRDYLEQLDPAERARHVVEDHCRHYWGQLAELKRNSASPDLKVALVLDYGMRYIGSDPDEHDDSVESQLRASRWLAAYAKAKGFEFGHMRFDNGSHLVRYDPDPLLHWLPQTEHKLPEPSEIQDDTIKGSLEDCLQFRVDYWQRWEVNYYY